MLATLCLSTSWINQAVGRKYLDALLLDDMGRIVETRYVQ